MFRESSKSSVLKRERRATAPNWLQGPTWPEISNEVELAETLTSEAADSARV